VSGDIGRSLSGDEWRVTEGGGEVKRSDEALELAARIDGRCLSFAYFSSANTTKDFWATFSHMSEKAFFPKERFTTDEKVFALCLYAVILEDEVN
jgi:hypothetical protein